MQVEVHDEGVEPLLADWEGLFAADSEATPFSSPGWAHAWLRHWPGARRPWIVAVRDGGRLVGLAPLIIRQRGPFRTLTELGKEPGNYWDTLALPELRADVTRAVAEEIVRRRRDWDLLLLRCLPPGSATEPALTGAGLRVRPRPPLPYPGIELPESFDEYLDALPRRRRKDLRRHLRRLDEGELEIRHVREAEELPEVIERWQDIRLRWWEERGKRMHVQHRSKQFRDFVKELAVLLVPAGLAEVWELRLDGRVVGVEVNLVDSRVFYAWMGAYEPDVAQLGLGKVAIGASIRSSIVAGRRYYDLMVGDEPYKYWYGASDRYCESLMAGSGRPRSQAALAAGMLANLARRARSASASEP
jgi:CelD/BcsL family acetyltransferase involved in cellulose biosynthesis